MNRGPEARDVRSNPFGLAGLIAAAVAIVLGVFSFPASFVVGVVAVILSGVGWYWWRVYRVGRMPAAAGLVIGGAATLISLYFALNGM
ncbi:hypothetical protein P0L94_01415 [Microbacter sp. GSS18]|nr:hypothetical protein P0L94_01415 [Microbacter sp. GSS18]